MAELVKICPRCHHHNPDTVNSCESCPSTLAGVPAEDPDAPEEASPAQLPPVLPGIAGADSLRLELAEDPSRVFVVRAGQTLGAPDHEGAPDVVLAGVPKEDYISGRHVMVLRDGPDWFVKHLGRTNYIVVDGVRYSDAAEVPIREGTSLFLTYTEFIVRRGDGIE